MRANDSAAAEEPRTTNRRQWRELVTAVLRNSGADVESAAEEPERLLASHTYDDIRVDPLYVDATPDPGPPGLAPFTRGARPQGSAVSGWEVRQRHADPDPATTRHAIAADGEAGVNALWLVVGAEGLDPGDIDEALADTALDRTPVVLQADSASERAAEELLAVHARRRVPPDAVTGNLGLDPLGLLARWGEPVDVDDAARFAARTSAEYPRLRAITVDATVHHDAGGSEAQELGASMAAGVAYLRALTEAGLDPATAAGRLEFRYATSADQFLSIAKLRAARAMWNRVTQVCGLAERHRGMRQHAVTSAAMMTRRDPYVNIPRATIACLAAGVGGADAITVRPFDAALGRPDPLARRIARNTHAILMAESHMARVIDPAGGSFYVEHLTNDLFEAGWRFFQEIEAAGGMAAALRQGLVAERVNAVWERRRRELAHRRDPITGVSVFPDLGEPDLERLPAPSPPAPATAIGLPPRRYAQDFEALRDRSDAHLREHGARPRVFLATLGPVAAHNERATFVANLLRAGGIEPLPGGEATTPEAAADLFAASRAEVACICSSDEIYAERAGATARALRAAGARRVLLAGRPGRHHDEYAAAGVAGCIHTGCDALSLLEELTDFLGVAK